MKSYHKNSSPGRTLQKFIQYSYIIIFTSHIYNSNNSYNNFVQKEIYTKTSYQL